MNQGIELIVRKQEAKFIEKLFRHFNYVFNHDAFKAIIYSEAGCHNPSEEKMKNYYDAYCYLLNNYQNPLSEDILRRYFYILKGKEADSDLVTRLATAFFLFGNNMTIDKAIEYHLNAYQEIVEYEEEDRTMISLMLLNYALVKSNIRSIALLETDLDKYEKAKKKYLRGDKGPIYELLMDIIYNSKKQDKKYYEELIELSGQDVYQGIIEDKEMLEKEGIKHIFVFGSFGSSKERLDSDIDLLVMLKPEVFYEKKEEMISFLSKHYYVKFKRFVDITACGEYLDDVIIKEMKNAQKIF